MPVSADHKIAGARVLLHLPVLNYKKAIAIQGHILRLACSRIRGPGGKVRCDGAYLGARADLRRIAGAVFPYLLVEQVAELHILALVSHGIHVGKVVGNGIESRVIGLKTRKWYEKRWHISSASS